LTRWEHYGIIGRVKKILLSQGKCAIVDNEDYKWLNQWKWYASSSGYANRHPPMIRGKRKGKIMMHRLIMNAPLDKNIDHINRDELDNRKSNLRFATVSQNGANSGLPKNNTSGYKGVHWIKKDKCWMSRIMVNGKRKCLACTKSKKKAVEKYRQAAIKFNGEFANV